MFKKGNFQKILLIGRDFNVINKVFASPKTKSKQSFPFQTAVS